MSTKAEITKLEQDGTQIRKVWTDNSDFKMGDVTLVHRAGRGGRHGGTSLFLTGRDAQGVSGITCAE